MEMNKEKLDPLAELVFLRQMVHRLNAALSKQQGADILNMDEHTMLGLSTSTEEHAAPWLTNPILLSPLINEYETHLAALVLKVSTLSSENQECVNKLKSITEENERLHAELHNVIQQQLQDVESSGVINTQDDSALRNLQAHLELVCKEKDTALEMHRETMRILDKVRQERLSEVAHAKSRERIFNETKARNEQLQDSNLHMQMAIDSFQKENHTLTLAATQQSSDITRYQEQLREAKRGLREQKQKSEEMKIKITSQNHKLSNLKQEVSDLDSKDHMASLEIQQLQGALMDAEHKLAHALQAASDAQSQVDSLKIHITALEKTNGDLDNKEMGFLIQIRESAQLLDDALLARDSALVREKQKQEDLDKASTAIEELVNEVADRVKNEVDKVKKKYDLKIRRLAEDVESMELEAANLRSEADRAKRAKRAVEDELDSLSRQRDEAKENHRVEEFQRRTINAERARDDAFITIQTLEDKIKREKMEQEDSQLRLLSSNQALEQRIKRLERETEECQHERLHLLESVNQYRHDNQKLEETARSARLNSAKEFAASEDSLKREKKQLEVRLRSMEEANQGSVRQLHKMLSDQQRIAARWKEEGKSACEKYEDRIRDLQSQLSHQRRKYQDQTNRMKPMGNAAEITNENIPPVKAYISAEESKKRDPRISQMEETNRQLKAQLHETEYKLVSATQKLGESQSLRNSFSIRSLN